MSPERGMREGWGADLETEASAENAELQEELDEFETSWQNPDNAIALGKLLSKWRVSKDPESIRDQMTELDKELVDTDGEEAQINSIIERWAKGKKSAVETAEEEGDSDDEEYEEAA